MIVNIIKRNLYQDSVALMQVAAQLKTRPGIADASLVMGTPPNKEILQDAGLLVAEGESAAPNDLIAALSGPEEALAQATAKIDRLLEGRATGAGARAPRARPNPAGGPDVV
jgi:hypothetical protein